MDRNIFHVKSLALQFLCHWYTLVTVTFTLSIYERFSDAYNRSLFYFLISTYFAVYGKNSLALLELFNKYLNMNNTSYAAVFEYKRYIFTKKYFYRSLI